MPKSKNPETETKHKKPHLPFRHLLILLKQHVIGDPLHECKILKRYTLRRARTSTKAMLLIPQLGENHLGMKRRKGGGQTGPLAKL